MKRSPGVKRESSERTAGQESIPGPALSVSGCANTPLAAVLRLQDQWRQGCLVEIKHLRQVPDRAVIRHATRQTKLVLYKRVNRAKVVPAVNHSLGPAVREI